MGHTDTRNAQPGSAKSCEDLLLSFAISIIGNTRQLSRILQPSEVLDFAVGLLHKRAVDGTFSCSVLHRLRLGSVVLCFAAEGRCLGLLGADGPVQTRPIRPMMRVTSRPRKMGSSLFSDWSEDQLATT